MRRTGRLVASLVVLNACGSDDTPAVDGGADGTAQDAAAIETSAPDASDAGVEAGCEKQACLDTASTCALGCDDQYNTCEGNCTTQKCMTGCKDAEATCLSGCLTTCKTCAADAACALPLCADAATP
jgi:hypothetical protein